MDFGQAVDLLKKGERVARSGWNGKGMWLSHYQPESVYDGYEWYPFIVMKTADDKVVPWLASQTDVLAEDWVELE